MKKIFLSLAAVASLVLASCTGDYTDWASPQAYSQEEAAAKYGITFTAGPDANVVMPAEEADVKLVEIIAENANISGYTVKSFTVNGELIDAATSGNYITANAAALSKLVEKQNNSRAAVARPIEIKTIVSINLSDGDAIAFDTEATINGTVTPKPTPAIDSKGYFLLGGFQENADDAGNGWQADRPVWMTDNGDGTFTAIVNTLAEGDNWYKFYAGSYFVSGNWDSINQGEMGCAVNGDNSLQNFLVYTGDDQAVQTPVISGDGQWKIVLDMNNLVYTVTRQAVNYYIIGGPNDWAGSAAEKPLKFTQPDPEVPTYTITFPAASGDTWFAIGDDKACDAIVNDNDWTKLYGTTSGNGNSGQSGTLARRSELTDDGSFMVAEGAKFIKVVLDMRAMTYEISTLNFAEYIYEAGNDNNWGEVQKPLYCADGQGTYTGWFEVRQASWGIGFKFRGAADNWDEGNWGAGTFSDEGGTLTDTEAGNLEATPGFYRADVNLATMTYTLTRVNTIDVIGDATPNGWDAGTELTYNANELCWEVTLDLKEGSMKFRANGTWSNDDGNWGGASYNDIRNGSNDNLPVTKAGRAHIKFYPLCDTRSYCTVDYE
ncbi:MAG: DUF5115 domain-containing protein [Prevotella sp.]|nr:DUF5115 domain-containing protein [Prevotella sp.]